MFGCDWNSLLCWANRFIAASNADVDGVDNDAGAELILLACNFGNVIGLGGGQQVNDADFIAQSCRKHPNPDLSDGVSVAWQGMKVDIEAECGLRCV